MSHARILIRVSLTLLIVQSASCDWKPNNAKKETLCTTDDCKMRGDDYKNNLNARVNPCEDFYTFTCGNWLKNHPGPKYDSQWNTVEVVNTGFAFLLKHAIETYATPPGGDRNIKLAKQVYETCVRIPDYPIKEAKYIAQEITKIGRYPAIPLWELHNKYLKLSGESAFFASKIIASTPSEEIPVLMLTEPYSAFGAIFHELVWKPQEKKNYLEFLFRIMKSLNFNVSDAELKNVIEQVFQFRENLEQILDTSLKKKPGRFNPLTKRELNNWQTENFRSMTNNQRIPWSDVVDILLNHLTAETRTTKRVVAIRQKQYFVELIKFIRNVPEDVLANHIEINFVERHLKWNDDMMRILESTSIEPHSKIRYVRERYFPRWQLCIEKHSMPETLEAMLFQKWFPMDHQQSIEQMIVKLKAAMDDQMKHSSWMDQQTRINIMGKLNGLKQWIGFPTWYNRREIPEERENKKGILTPNATFNIVMNLLYIHAPLMMPPMFSLKLPALYNYGTLGTTIGHELFHVMNDCGVYKDRIRNVNWWSPDIQEQCHSKMNAFIPVFNKITNREFKTHYNIDVESDTTISLSENFPDVMGLEAAYNAYKQLVTTDKSACQVLPGFKDYSCDQMFYIAYGNSFCGRLLKKAALRKLQISEHGIDSVRINGGVAQMESFASAFKCPVGSPMNPERKVNLLR